jgi:hypothetical protein
MTVVLLHDRASVHDDHVSVHDDHVNVHDDHVNVHDGRENENGKTVEVSKKFLPTVDNCRISRRTVCQAFWQTE